MHTLDHILSQDARAQHDANLPPEAYREILAGAVRPFREASLRRWFPTTVVNRPGVLKSRAIKVVDIGDALHGTAGTGGTFDRIDLSTVDEVAYAIWKNGEIAWRDEETSREIDISLLEETGVALGAKTVDLENELLLNGLGPVKGITNATGIQTFTGDDWGTAGNAYANIVKAIVDKMGTEKVPEGIRKVLFVNPIQAAELYSKDNTKRAIDEIKGTFPIDIVSTTRVAAGKGYVMAASMDIVHCKVYQDLSVIPLPKTDEDHRIRTRVILALHKKQPKGIVEMTGI